MWVKFSLCMLTSASRLGCQVHTQPTWNISISLVFIVKSRGEITEHGGESVGQYSLRILHQHLDNNFDKWTSHVDFYLFQLLWITRQRAGWCSSTEPSSWWMEVLAMSSNLLPCVKVPQHTRLHVHKQAHVHKTNQCLHTHIKADVQTSVYFLWLDWLTCSLCTPQDKKVSDVVSNDFYIVEVVSATTSCCTFFFFLSVFINEMQLKKIMLPATVYECLNSSLVQSLKLFYSFFLIICFV